MRTRRNPTRRSILRYVMPINTDPDVSPSTSSSRSSTSHSSNWNLTFEREHSHKPSSFEPAAKIDQLIKVNEAIAFELAHLESSKERWLEKLKLLEARICSNKVNIEKWAIENKSNPVSIQDFNIGTMAIDKLEEGSVSELPLAWRLSLSDLASIFKSSSFELSEKLSSQRQRHGVAASSRPRLCSDGYADARGLHACHDDNAVDEAPLGNGADDVVFCSPKEAEISEKAAKLAIPTVAGPDRRETLGSKRATDDVDGAHADMESFGSVSTEGNSSLRSVNARDNNEDKLTSNDSCGPLDLDVMSEVNVREDLIHDTRGIQLMSSNEKGTNRTPFTQAKEKNCAVGAGRADHIASLNHAKKQVQQAEQHAAATEREKVNLESALRESEHSLEVAKLEIDKLTSQKEELQCILSECRTSLESAQINLMNEKDEKEHKLLRSMQSLEELQQNVTVLERHKLVLCSELNHFKHAYEKEKDQVVSLKRDKTAFELDLCDRKRMLTEAQDNLMSLEKLRDTLVTELGQTKDSLQKSQQQCLILEQANTELQDGLTESKHGFEKVVENYSTTKQEKDNLEVAQKELILGLKESEQQSLMLKAENEMLEILLAEFKLSLQGAQQQVVALEEERETLKCDLMQSIRNFEERARQAILLEEEKVALKLKSCEYEQVTRETQQHVVTLQNALEATLQRADALDHQAQRLHHEIKRLRENHENLQALKDEQEIKSRDLETQKEVLQVGLGNLKSKLLVTEETLAKVNSEYVSTIKSREEERARMRESLEQQLLLENDNSNLKWSLETAKQQLQLLETEQGRLEMRLEEAECSLRDVMQDSEASSADHMNEVAALRVENAAIEFKGQELTEQVHRKTLELERLSLVEANLNRLTEKLTSLEQDLISTTAELDSVKLNLSCKLIELETERSTKAAVTQELNMNRVKLDELEKELSRVRAEQQGLRGAMMDEMVKKKELMKKLRAEQDLCKKLEIAFELKQNNMLAHSEEEKMAKEAAMEDVEVMKRHSDEVEKDLHELQVQVQMLGQNDDRQNAIFAERSRCKDLEKALDLRNAEQQDINFALEGERHANEVLLIELEEQQNQRMWLEEQLKMSKANEEEAVTALLNEKTAHQNLKEHTSTLEARCKELETANQNTPKIEQQIMDCKMESGNPAVREVDDQGDVCLKPNVSEAMANYKSNHTDSVTEKIRSNLAEIISKSKSLEDTLNVGEKEGSSLKKTIQSDLSLEIGVLQSLLQDNQSTMASVGHAKIDEKEKERKQKEDELLAILKESTAFGMRVPDLEDCSGHSCCDSSMDVGRQPVEFKQTKENTKISPFLDSHHTAIVDLAGLLVELESLKRLLITSESVLDSDKKEEKKRSNLSMPTAALSTSALAALGLLALLKSSKINTS